MVRALGSSMLFSSESHLCELWLIPLCMWQVWHFFLPCLIHSSRARLFPPSLQSVPLGLETVCSLLPCCPSAAECCQDSWEPSGSLVGSIPGSPAPGLAALVFISHLSNRGKRKPRKASLQWPLAHYKCQSHDSQCFSPGGH